MAHLLWLLYFVLIVVAFSSVSANLVIYNVTFVPCVQGSTCPQGNLLSYNATFALNGTLSPNITLNVGDTLQFNLATTVPSHPLTICQNSVVPSFCQGAASTNLLNSPITNAGTTTSVVFSTSGTYYYGCNNHPGMGAMINVIQTVTAAVSASTTVVTSTAATAIVVTSSVSTANTASSVATAMVTSASTGSTSSSTKGTGARHQLSVLFLFTVIVALFTIIFT
ncbi:unnamed protein product [Adineta steineri]|uniref:Blue (type 1) copper domain-containing protein n=3 Tax=Adineta steineri TaxID=433720 RepID=A0A819QDV6_9BILA|nr:unnamed protein product [Adineta steineri]CAF4024478.1 unnamed protein product [Adineta steineri]